MIKKGKKGAEADMSPKTGKVPFLTPNLGPISSTTVQSSVSRKYQIVFCYTILERNSRHALPVVQSSSGRDHVSTNTNPLDSFFPFDPYLLKRCSSDLWTHQAKHCFSVILMFFCLCACAGLGWWSSRCIKSGRNWQTRSCFPLKPSSRWGGAMLFKRFSSRTWRMKFFRGRAFI